MPITKEDVVYISKLAKIEITPNKLDSIANDMDQIVSLVEQINKLDTTNVKPLSNVMDHINVSRKDTPKESMPLSDVQKNAPAFDDGHIVVPAVIE